MVVQRFGLVLIGMRRMRVILVCLLPMHTIKIDECILRLLESIP